MAFRPISTRRLHVLYTTPLLLSLTCILLVLFSLCGLVPWHQTPGSVLIVHRASVNGSDDGQTNGTGSFHFGLLGSCYRPSDGEKLQCTSASFPPDFTTTIDRGGSSLNAAHLQISMPDLPPVFMVWLSVSLIALVCEFLGSLPHYAPQRLSHCRRLTGKFFSAALWILGIGWAFGFSAVLALACFVQGFGDEYNRFSVLFLYDTAVAGHIFVPLTIALVVQVIVGITVIIRIANASNEEREIYTNTPWTTHLKVNGP